MATATSAPEINVYGTIGEDTTDRSFATEMDDLRNASTIDIRINSGGGSVTQGLAIYNSIMRARNQGRRIDTHCDGAAFSMAAIIFQAGTRRVISESALVMLHPPFMYEGGNAQELRKSADSLDKVEGQLVNIVARRSGQSLATVKQWFSTETWFDANEAVAAGLADVRSRLNGSGRARQTELILAQYKVPTRYATARRAPVEAELQSLKIDRDIALHCDRYTTYTNYAHNAARRASKLLDMPGVTTDDLKRVEKLLDDIKFAETYPRQFD